MIDTAKEAGMLDWRAEAQAAAKTVFCDGYVLHGLLGFPRAVNAALNVAERALSVAQPPVSEGVVEAGMRISDEAVEAGAEVIWDSFTGARAGSRYKSAPDNSIAKIACRNTSRAVLTAALPHLQAQEWQIERDEILAALKHIVTIPENAPGGLTVRDAMTAMVAMAQSTINKAEARTLIAEQRREGGSR